MGLTTIEQETLSAVKVAAHKYSKGEINWEQRRYEISKDLLPCILSKHYINGGGYMYSDVEAVKYCVGLADTLINELKNE